MKLLFNTFRKLSPVLSFPTFYYAVTLLMSGAGDLFGTPGGGISDPIGDFFDMIFMIPVFFVGVIALLVIAFVILSIPIGMLVLGYNSYFVWVPCGSKAIRERMDGTYEPVIVEGKTRLCFTPTTFLNVLVPSSEKITVERLFQTVDNNYAQLEVELVYNMEFRNVEPIINGLVPLSVQPVAAALLEKSLNDGLLDFTNALTSEESLQLKNQELAPLRSKLISVVEDSNIGSFVTLESLQVISVSVEA